MATQVNRAFELVTEVGFVYGRSEAILAVNSIVGEQLRLQFDIVGSKKGRQGDPLGWLKNLSIFAVPLV